MLWVFTALIILVAHYTDNYTPDMGWAVLVVLLVLEFEAAIRKSSS